MKEINYEKSGLVELDSLEMSEANGGNWRIVSIATGWKIYAAYFILEVATNPQAHIDAFKAGWQAAGE